MSQELVDYGVRLLRAAEFIQRAADADQAEVLLWLPHAMAAGHVWLESADGGRVTALGIVGPADFKSVATLSRLLPTDLGPVPEAIYVCWFGAEADGSAAFRRMLADCRAAWPSATHVAARRRSDRRPRIRPLRLTQEVEA